MKSKTPSPFRVLHAIHSFITPLLFLLIPCHPDLNAQSGPYLFSGAGYLSNGQIGLLCDNAEATTVLPALLADRAHGGWTAGIATRTGLKDITEVAAAAHLRLPWKDQVGLSIQHTGIEGYQEQRVTLSYARKLFEKLNTGIQFDLNRNSAEGYEDVVSFSWAVCLQAPLLDQLSLSAWIYNPLGSEDDLDLPSLLKIGLLYAPGDKVSVAMEAEKDWRHEMRFKAGFNYHLHPRLALHWGVGTSPSLVHAGITWNLLHHVALSGGWRYHSRLGSSLAASVSQYNEP